MLIMNDVISSAYVSARTLDLKLKRSTAQSKLRALKAAKSSLDGISAEEIKTSYDGIDATVLYGNKYDLMKEEESETITTEKDSYLSERDKAAKKVNAAIKSIEATIDDLDSAIAESEASDREENARRERERAEQAAKK